MNVFEIVFDKESLHILACHIEHLKQISSALSENMSREDLIYRSFIPGRLRGNFYSEWSRKASEQLGSKVSLNETEQKVYDLLKNFHDKTLALENAVLMFELDMKLISECANELLCVLEDEVYNFKDPHE